MVAMKEAYEEKIRALIEPAIEAEGMELILSECLMMKGRWIVRLYVDKPGKVTIDDCSVVSQLVGDILDVHDVPPAAYTLEVSSPGLNRPLARDKDFVKYCGQRVSIQTMVKIDGIRNFRGVLVDYVDKDGQKALLLEVEGKSCTIPRKAILNAHLEYDFKE
jgi:ribosome maturation factor RimP